MSTEIFKITPTTPLLSSMLHLIVCYAVGYTFSPYSCYSLYSHYLLLFYILAPVKVCQMIHQQFLFTVYPFIWRHIQLDDLDAGENIKTS